MQILITNQPHTVFATVTAAEAVLPEDDEDLKYEISVDPNGSGKAIIKVYDAADGSFISNL